MIKKESIPTAQEADLLEDLNEDDLEYAPEDGFYKELDFNEA